MRLIDADALDFSYKNVGGTADECSVDDVKAYIASAPTIEAEPVRRGRMIEGRYPNEDKCSECGQIFRDDIWFIYPYDENGVCKTPKRCPDCGCYWDGGAEDG